GCATRTSFAGHTGRSAKTRHALTLNPDHLRGAGQTALNTIWGVVTLSENDCAYPGGAQFTLIS
ncbi:hypothetical protein, partial [Mesorhizobium sp. A556]